MGTQVRLGCVRRNARTVWWPGGVARIGRTRISMTVTIETTAGFRPVATSSFTTCRATGCVASGRVEERREHGGVEQHPIALGDRLEKRRQGRLDLLAPGGTFTADELQDFLSGPVDARQAARELPGNEMQMSDARLSRVGLETMTSSGAASRMRTIA
jgi:hypothetical protein